MKEEEESEVVVVVKDINDGGGICVCEATYRNKVRSQWLSKKKKQTKK